jgi:glycosyltransferase involved in cell wall biosynthesis
MRKILIVSQSHLCRNPRVLKEALALAGNNYAVTILTSIYSEQLWHEDMELLRGTNIDYQFYSDLRQKSFQSFKLRLIKKIYTDLNSILRIQSRFSLGYGAGRLMQLCIRQGADVLIMHQELAMVTGCILLKKKYRVFFDIEDWYSEDLLPGNRKKRPLKLLKKSEKFALLHSKCCYTTSNAMADGIANAYGLPKAPSVIYNTFEEIQKAAEKKRGESPLKLYWFSQTIGPGRGIEQFIEAMGKSSYQWDLTLRGNVSEDYKLLLMNQMNPKDQLCFRSMIRNDELLADMQNFDIGLALEPESPPNKNLTISNKFFHYLAGGLSMIASDTLGHLEIGTRHPEIIFIYKNNDIANLTGLLDEIGRKNKGRRMKRPDVIISLFKSAYSWTVESQKLLSLINKAL